MQQNLNITLKQICKNAERQILCTLVRIKHHVTNGQSIKMSRLIQRDFSYFLYKKRNWSIDGHLKIFYPKQFLEIEFMIFWPFKKRNSAKNFGQN
jgi:hypothetical protein